MYAANKATEGLIYNRKSILYTILAPEERYISLYSKLFRQSLITTYVFSS